MTHPAVRHVADMATDIAWLALLAVVEGLEADRPVLFLDYEDSPRSIARRLLALGVSEERIVRHLVYIQPDGPFDVLAREAVDELVGERGIRLAVIDSTGEALAAAGANPNSDDDVTRWFTQLPRHLERRLGLTVITVDHVPKDQENAPALYAIGSQRKRAAISGSLVKVVGLEPFARGKTGRMKLVVAKDRPGTFPQGTTVAEVTVESTEDGREVRITVAPPAAVDQATGTVERPTVLMERISRWLELNPGPHSVREVVTEVKGKDGAKRRALRVLIDEGFVAEEPGQRGAVLVRHATTFRDNPQGNRLDGGVEEADRGPAARPRPDRGPAAVNGTPMTAARRGPDDPEGVGARAAVEGLTSPKDALDAWGSAAPAPPTLANTDRGPSRNAVIEDDLPW